MCKSKVIFFATIVAATTGVANASSPAAWAELYAKSSAACAKASNFNGAKARGERIDFRALVLVILDGRHPQPHMKNAAGVAYCLYDKQTGKTEVSAALADAPVANKVDVATGRTCWTKSFGAQLKSAQPIGTKCSAQNDEGDTDQGVVKQ